MIRIVILFFILMIILAFVLVRHSTEHYATTGSLPPLNWVELDEDDKGRYFYFDPTVPGEFESHSNREQQDDRPYDPYAIDRTNVDDIFGKSNYLRYYLDDMDK